MKKAHHHVPKDKLRNVLSYSFYGSPDSARLYSKPHLPKYEQFVYEMKGNGKALIFERRHKGKHGNERCIAGVRINYESGRVQIFRPKTVDESDYRNALPELREDLKKGYDLYNRYHSDRERKYKKEHNL